MRALAGLAVVVVVLSSLALAASCRKPARRSLGAAAPAATRTLTFTNQCGFDVWIQSVGSNAANLPCSPSTTSAQANCPDGFLCYQAGASTQYCVPGTTQATTFPITDPSQVTLDAALCPSGTVQTITSSAQWGQCTCATSAGCAANQVCGPVGGVSQCFWGFTLPDGGHLTAAGTDGATGTISIGASSTATTAIVASGNFFAQLACGANGNCLSNSNQGAPATRIEYTLANDQDFYDVSYINGVNVPAVMTPVLSTALAYDAADPYRCLAAGGDAATLQAIAAFQQQHQLARNTALQAFACTNDYAAAFVGARQGFNFVSQPATPTACSSASDCTGGTVCGLTLTAVTGAGQLTCGQRLGYWSYTQLCAANPAFASSTLGVACDDAQAQAYAACTDQAGVADQGPGRSCFNSNTTVAGDTCCGFSAWSFGGKAQPMAIGQSAVTGVDTSFWTANILPVITPIKAGCPLAYAFQFDDPYATFTCATTGSPNATSYAITLCPGGDSAGVDPPPPPTCTAVVPSGNAADQFVIGPPAGITVAVAACDAAGSSCTTPVPPDGGSGSVYTATGAPLYQITASAGATQQVCQFAIPTSGCILAAGDAGQPPCSLWTVATDGAWAGRSIGIFDFASAGARPRTGPARPR